ncbi:hypothetical protein [Bifidobacterium sp.]
MTFGNEWVLMQRHRLIAMRIILRFIAKSIARSIVGIIAYLGIIL